MVVLISLANDAALVPPDWLVPDTPQLSYGAPSSTSPSPFLIFFFPVGPSIFAMAFGHVRVRVCIGLVCTFHVPESWVFIRIYVLLSG